MSRTRPGKTEVPDRHGISLLPPGDEVNALVWRALGRYPPDRPASFDPSGDWLCARDVLLEYTTARPGGQEPWWWRVGTAVRWAGTALWVCELGTPEATRRCWGAGSSYVVPPPPGKEFDGGTVANSLPLACCRAVLLSRFWPDARDLKPTLL